MAKANLHGDGWRQGSLIQATLKAQVLDNDGREQTVDFEHDLWFLATQDCDLAQTKTTDATKKLELRPIFAKEKTDAVDGIRSKVVKVTDDLVLRADSPRIMLTARALTALKNKREDLKDETRRREIKTWLGLRYDRPAVPELFVPTAKVLLEVLGPVEQFNGKVRDILVYYHDPMRVNLFVVLRARDDKKEIQDWLDEKIGELLDNALVVSGRHVEHSSATPFEVIETYYGLFSDELSLTTLRVEISQ
jgi:hypothetical protein